MSDLVIVLPGGNYTPLGPAIRFPVLAASEAGYRSVAVEYSPEAIRAQDLPAVVDGVRRQLVAAITADAPARVAIIAKSMGTRVIVEVADLLDDIEELSVVWLTPLFGDPGIRDAAIRSGWRSLVVFGDQDPYHDPEGVTAVTQALNAPVVALPGADHALEVPGDLLATIAGLRDVAVGVREFLGP